MKYDERIYFDLIRSSESAVAGVKRIVTVLIICKHLIFFLCLSYLNDMQDNLKDLAFHLMNILCFRRVLPQWYAGQIERPGVSFDKYVILCWGVSYLNDMQDKLKDLVFHLINTLSCV